MRIVVCLIMAMGFAASSACDAKPRTELASATQAAISTEPAAAEAASPPPSPNPVFHLPLVEREDPNDTSDWYARITSAVEMGPVRIGAPVSKLREAIPDIGECRDPDHSMYCSLGPSNGLSFEVNQDRVITISASWGDSSGHLDLPMGLRFGSSMFDTLKALCERSNNRWVVRTPDSPVAIVLNLALLAYPKQPERFTMAPIFRSDVLDGISLQEIEDYGSLQ